MGAAADIGSILAFAARRGSRERADAVSAKDVHVSRLGGHSLPLGLEVQWLGTSGYRLQYQGTTLLIDPYVSRVTLGDVVFRRAIASDPALVATHIPAADAILLGHTHFDHALDAPAIAAKFGAKVYGSASARHLMELSGRGDLAVQIEPYKVYPIGPFEVSFVPSVHSKLVLGWTIPYDGDITCEHFDGLTAPRFCCGDVWGIHIAVAGLTFYHQGSADLIDDAIRHRQVDFFLAGIAGRRFTKDYVKRILTALEPHVIIPSHYDNFFRPLGSPLAFSTNVNFTRFLEEVGSVSKEFALGALEPLEELGAGLAASRRQDDGSTSG